MLIYLDTVVAIYAIEGAPPFKPRAIARLAAAKAAGDRIATSDLTRLECLVKPLRIQDAQLHGYYLRFLSNTSVFSLSPRVYDEAAKIRAIHNFRVPDALHLAVAIESKCDLFLTNDNRLAGFSGIPVELLP